MCETYTKLPSMFFKKEELEGVERACDIDWERASYQQISLVDFDESYNLDQRTEKSGRPHRILREPRHDSADKYRTLGVHRR